MEALIAFDSVQKSPNPELEVVDIITRTSCDEENGFGLIKHLTLNATLYTAEEEAASAEPELDLASCIVPSTEWGNPSCPIMTDFIIDGIGKPEPKSDKQRDNIIKVGRCFSSLFNQTSSESHLACPSRVEGS